MTPRKQVTYSSRPNHAARVAHKAGERQFRTYDTSHIRPKKSKTPIIFAIVLAIIVLGGLGWGGYTLFTSCSSTATASVLAEGESVTVTIPEGSGAKAIGDLLVQNGVIADSAEFVRIVTSDGRDASLKPGMYTFTGPLTLQETIDQLVVGPNAAGLSLTIPEGYTIARIADAVAEATSGKVTAADFTAAAHNASAYAADFPFVADAYNNSLEGFLFPKTYPLEDSATADSIVRQMLAQYKTETAGLDYAFAESAGLTPYDVLKLASVVEKEATADNRAKVASVFYNRLAISMPLQSDATTAYVVGGDPTPDDLKVEGPYNTYLNNGLPAGPICSPGLDCIKAVLAPETTTYLYFYFVPNDAGGMDYFFSETYDEHLAAIAGA
ncbi:MAG: endolytic transglycosylase MltG [Raoultibacter sp.]